VLNIYVPKDSIIEVEDIVAEEVEDEPDNTNDNTLEISYNALSQFSSLQTMKYHKHFK